MKLRLYSKLQSLNKFAYVSIGFVSVSSAYAGELKVDPSVDTTAYVYETKKESETAKSNQAIVLVPSVVTSYSAKRLMTSLRVEQTIVEQNKDIDGADKNYTDYKYNGALTVIPNSLNIGITGQQGYRVIAQQQEFVADRVLAPGDLTKYSQNSGFINFRIQNPKYVGLNIQTSYSKTESDRSIDSPTGINGDNTSASVQLYQGRHARYYTFNFSVQHNNTSRTSFQDFESSQAQGSIGVSFARNISFIVTGNIYEYDTNGEVLSRRTNLDTKSYGAGIEWKPRAERKLSLTYNRLEEGANQNNYIGINLDWAFSIRTALKFDYSKRFYGDAYSLDLSHALKNVRSSITYRELVTTFARLETTVNPVGLFVCQFGSTDLADCFQASSSAYELQAGQEFRTLPQIGSDISEETIFRKVGAYNLSYQKRRVKASINATYSRTEYLESDRVQTSRNVRINLAYELGRKTNLSLSTSLASNSYGDAIKADTIINSKIEFRRDMNQNLRFTTGLGIIDRNSEVEGRNIQDKRLTMGLNYQF